MTDEYLTIHERSFADAKQLAPSLETRLRKPDFLLRLDGDEISDAFIFASFTLQQSKTASAVCDVRKVLRRRQRTIPKIACKLKFWRFSF